MDRRVKEEEIELNLFTQLMEEAKRVNQDKIDETNLCKQDKHPKNFLDRFSPEETLKESQDSNSNPPHEPDLSLRLSLGSFDGESSKENTLTRSSSIAGVLTLRKDSGEVEKSFLSLARSCSLPTEAEKEQRLITLRELQAMRRIEAKNRLVERQRSFKEGKEKEKCLAPGTMPNLPAEVTAWAATPAERSPPLYQTIVKIKAQEHLAETKRGMYFPLMSQAPASLHGKEGSATPNQPSMFKSSSDPRNAEPVFTSGITSNGMLVKPVESKPGNPYKRARISDGNFQDNGIDVMRQMPSVTTTGDGPNGKRIEGFLYTYTRGHVSIVCVCHGSFLSPAEFVKHAGGKDVPNPMKHITVYSASSA